MVRGADGRGGGVEEVAMRVSRFAASSAVLLLCAAVSCVLVAVLGARHHARWDLTAARDFTLSERTRRALAGVSEATTIVVSADLLGLDRATRVRVADLLDEFARASEKVRTAWIDTGSASGQEQFDGLIASLAAAEGDRLRGQRERLETAAEECGEIAGALRGVSDVLKAAGEGAGDQAAEGPRLREQAGLVRTLAAAVDPVIEALRAAAGHAIAGVSLPAVDDARRAASEALDKAARGAGAVAEFAGARIDHASGEAPAAWLRELRGLATGARDSAARVLDAVGRERPSEALIVARVLQQSSAVLVTSAGGTIALDFGTLFPQSALADGAGGGADTMFVGEQMIATAIGSLSRPEGGAIAVFVHGQTARLLDDRGEPTAAGRAALGRLFERFRLTRTTPAEWAAAMEPMRPDLTGIDPSGARAVVWIVLGAPARASGDARDGAGLGERLARAAKLGGALRVLLEAGERVLVCVEPSDLPSIGEADPVAREIGLLGITVDSARPILRREASPQGPMTWTYHVFSRASRDHPIGSAVDGLRVVLPWATAIDVGEAVEGGGVTGLLTVPAEGKAWGESQWMLLRDLVGRGLSRPLAPLLLTDPPRVDEERDRAAGDRGFVVAAAVERPGSAGKASPRRAVVVASPEWLFDGYTQASEDVGGKRVALFPGNLELFDASLAWLAGRDDEIAPGPQARDVPRIEPISEGMLRLIRLLLVVGLPSLPIVVWGIVRMARG